MLSLALCVLVQTASPLQTYLLSSSVIDGGVIVTLASFVGIVSKKLPFYFCYDMFSAATLLVWFAYWKPEFNDDSPIFFFFPLYFAVAASFMTLYLMGQVDKVDKETLHYMQNYLQYTTCLQPWLVMPGVLVTLELQEQYLLYPTGMTLLMIRFAFASCMDRKPI
jgi:hypothetical protein